MQFIPKHKLVVFLHVPKSAGSTLRRVLFANYERSRIAWLSRDTGSHSLEVEAAIDRDPPAQLIGGHFRFGITDDLQLNAPYLTMLRDPVDRVRSLYHYILSNPRHRHHKSLVESDHDLAAFVADPISPEVRNLQTRLIAGLRPGEEADTGDLTIAKERLRRNFISVGVSERFDESLVLLKEALGLVRTRYYSVNVNRRRPRSSLSPETLTTMQEANALDLELYQEAIRIMEEGLEALGETSVASELTALAAANRRLTVRARGSAVNSARTLRASAGSVKRRFRGG